eukprot:2214353-Amphidinium_carterae.1
MEPTSRMNWNQCSDQLRWLKEHLPLEALCDARVIQRKATPSPHAVEDAVSQYLELRTGKNQILNGGRLLACQFVGEWVQRPNL